MGKSLIKKMVSHATPCLFLVVIPPIIRGDLFLETVSSNGRIKINGCRLMAYLFLPYNMVPPCAYSVTTGIGKLQARNNKIYVPLFKQVKCLPQTTGAERASAAFVFSESEYGKCNQITAGIGGTCRKRLYLSARA